MIKYLLFAFILVLASSSAQAQLPSTAELQALFPKLSRESIVKVQADGSIYRYYYKSDLPLLKPELPFSERELINRNRQTFKPNLSVEAIYYIPLKGISVSENASLSNPQLILIYNTLRSISTLTGVEYYSQSRGRMRTLFKSAYAIDNMEGKNKIPDPLVNNIPVVSEVIIFQEDLTFGKNVSRAVYRNVGNKISLSITNLTDMRYALFPFVKSNNMHTDLILIPIEGGILIYGNISVKTLSFLGLEKKKQASFYNRLNTLFIWFKKNIDFDLPHS